MPSEYWRSGNMSNGSSSCMPISSIPSTAYDENRLAGNVPQGPRDGYNANGNNVDQMNKSREEWRLNPVGRGVLNTLSDAPNDAHKRWHCSSSCYIRQR